MNLKDLKDKARQAYRDQQTQDNEGGCGEPVGFIAGYLEGYRAAEAELQKLQEDVKLAAELLLTSSYTVDDEGNRLMDANEYVWVDKAANILKKYHVREK